MSIGVLFRNSVEKWSSIFGETDSRVYNSC